MMTIFRGKKLSDDRADKKDLLKVYKVEVVSEGQEVAPSQEIFICGICSPPVVSTVTFKHTSIPYFSG